MKQNLIDQIKAARKVSTPILAISTPDPAATMEALIATYSGNGNGTTAHPAFAWDAARGLTPALDENGRPNEAGVRALAELGIDVDPNTGLSSDLYKQTKMPNDALNFFVKCPGRSMLFMHNAHRWITSDRADTPNVQALWNMRDILKRKNGDAQGNPAPYRTVFLLGPAFAFPPDVANDIMLFDEPYPDNEELAAIVRKCWTAAQNAAGSKVGTLTDDIMARAIDAVSGIPAFPVEQSTLMSFTPAGLDIDALYERKRITIESTRGLRVYRGGEKFDDIGGCEQVKADLRLKMAGRRKFGGVAFFDEIEKGFAGTTATGGPGDNTGVADDFLGQILTYTQDLEVAAYLFVGPPGAAKSAMAKAIANEVGKPCIAVDLGGIKTGELGASERGLRIALKVITSVCNSRPLFVATCNSLANLPTELLRRFADIYFFDLPTKDERAKIWDIYRAKYDLPASDPTPKDDGWTGAEIKRCAQRAWEYNITLAKAATSIVPVARSRAEQIERLRLESNGRYLSAAYPGTYRYGKKDIAPAKEGRAMTFTDLATAVALKDMSES